MPIVNPDEPCYICGYGPHKRSGPEGHVYTTNAEADAWFRGQPQGDYPPLIIDGVLYSYGT